MKDSSKVSVYHEPASQVMVPCVYSYPIVKRKLVPPGATICLKGEICTCIKYGQTLPEDVDPNYPYDGDSIDRLLQNRE
ncbi:MAG: hypothetical protein ABJH04_07455 [Cyclobacteriaceae bacterium]